MNGSWRVDQPGTDPSWFLTETEANHAAGQRTPTAHAPVLVWFDAWPYSDGLFETDWRQVVREQLLARVGWLRMADA